MARKGREAEIIVEQLEKLLTGDFAEITSPDNIYDPVAETLREVDISVKGKFGSTKILVVIECRDRPSVAKEDVTWIEQLVTKTRDLNANKVIAVSTTDFTPAARNKANVNGIELRLLKEFDPLEVKEWVDNVTVENVNFKFEIVHMYFGLVNADIREKINPKKIKPANRTARQTRKSSEKIFLIEKIGKHISFNQKNSSQLAAGLSLEV